MLGLWNHISHPFKKNNMKILYALLIFVMSPSFSYAVSFNCQKATTFAEKEICNNPLLGKLDDALSENYKYMLAANIGSGAKKDIKTTQKIWLFNRDKCADKQCLVDAYRNRVDEVCDYPVIIGVHPVCTLSEEIK